MRGVGVEEAAAVGAEHLDGFLRGDRTLGDGLGGDGLGFAVGAGDGLGFDEFGGVVGAEVLDDTLGDEREGEDEGDRGEDPEDGAGHVDPEVAEGPGFAAGNTADERDGERHADGGGPEVMGGEAEHLGEIAHGGLGRVGLPVGVGGEGDGGVEGEGGLDVGEVLGIEVVEEAEMLDALDQVGEEHGGGRENEHDDGVLGPGHFVVAIYAGEPIEEALAGDEDGVEEGFATLEDGRHVKAHGLGEEEDDGDEKRDLKPAVERHGAFSLGFVMGMRQATAKARATADPLRG